MSKGINIGFLNFGIGGDNKELMAKLTEAEAKAIKIQTLMQSIGKGNASVQGSTLLQQTRSQNAINESLERQRALQEKTARETMRTEQLRQRMLSQSSISQGSLNSQVQDINGLLNSQNGILGSLTKRAAGLFTVYQAGNLVKEIVQVRGEIQQLELAFETMLGSKAASEAMMKDIVNLSLETPYTLTEMAGNVKQLIAMGIEADKVVQTMKNLGDVAAGVSVPIWRIAINYGQVAALGKLQGREVRDFAMAGVPIVQQLAEQMGKTTAEIQQMVSAGKIGFADVEEAFRRMSSEGGKFNNMMQKQNSSVLGQIGKLKEQVQLMLNSIGASSEGLIYGVLEAGSVLVHNYEKIGKTLIWLTAIYGTYRVGLAVNLIATQTLASSQLMLGLTLDKVTKMFRASNAAMLTNPYVAVTAAVVGLGYAMYKVMTATTALTEAEDRLGDAHADAAIEVSKEERKLRDLDKQLRESEKGSKEFKELKNEIIKQYGKYFANLDQEIERVGNLSTAYDTLTQSVKSSVIERQFQAFKEKETRELDGTIDEILKKAYRLITKKHRGEEGLRLYDAFYNSAMRGKELSKEDSDKLVTTGFNLFEGNASYYLHQIKEAREASQAMIEEYKKIYGFSDKTGSVKNNDEPEVKDLSYGDKYKSAKQEWETAKAELIKIEKDKDKFTEEQYRKAVANEKELKSVFNDLGGETNEKNHGTSKTKNSRLDALKQEIEVVKQAQREYDKLKEIMSSEAALDQIKAQTPFKNITKDLLTNEGLLSLIDSQLNALSGQKQTKENNEYIGSLFTLRNDTLSKIAKANVDKIEAELKQYKSEYSLFESLFSITADKEQAMQLSFGDPTTQIQTYREKLKQALDATSDPKLKEKLANELSELDFTSKADFSKQMAELVKEYQTIEEKIISIKATGEERRLAILKNADKATDDVVNRRLQANTEAVNKQVSEISLGAMQATASYQRLFSSMGEISTKELQYLINLWKQAVQNAKQGSDGRFTISVNGENYSTTDKELASLTNRILETETQLRSRNPFQALSDSFDQLAKKKAEIEQVKDQITELEKIQDAALKEQNQTGDQGLDGIINSTGLNISNLKKKLKELDAQKASSFQKIGVSIGAVAADLSTLTSSMSEVFGAFGDESTADTLAFVGQMTNSVADIAQGLTSGNPIQVISGIATGIVSIASFHDKKLDKAIKRSQLEVKKLEGSYADLSRFIARQLGAVTQEQAKQQLENLKSQQAELEKQMQAESKKKKSDQSAIQDYERSIEEIKDQIQYFQEDLFDQQYGFNLKNIAEQISSALVDAFKNGEDAAKAFDNTVSDIINQLASKMITMQVLEPAMNQIRDYLFGDNGVFNDGELSISDAQGLVGQMMNLKDSIGKSKDLWDALNDAAKQAGIDLSASSTKDTLSKGIESITEDTANLLASYLNAIRLDVSVNRQFLNQLVQLSQLNSNTFAVQLAELVKIQVNTLATANNTLRLVQLTESTNTILQKATISGSGTRFNI